MKEIQTRENPKIYSDIAEKNTNLRYTHRHGLDATEDAEDTTVGGYVWPPGIARNLSLADELSMALNNSDGKTESQDRLDVVLKIVYHFSFRLIQPLTHTPPPNHVAYTRSSFSFFSRFT